MLLQKFMNRNVRDSRNHKQQCVCGVVCSVYNFAYIRALINPRRACARVMVYSCRVCLSVCLSVYPSVPALASVETSKQRYSRVSLRLFLLCVEFRKNLPFKRYGVEKPICK